MEIVVGLIVTLALLAGVAVAAVAIVHRSQQRAITRDNQLMPGHPTRAPSSWAVSHDPEARLHRRLRDAMAALHAVDAMDSGAVAALIRQTGAQIVLNLGSSFVNMTVLQACIDTGAAYLDTAIHEDPAKVCETPPWYANYEWTRREACAAAGVTAILGAGFDPGVVNTWARLAADVYFDRIDSLDIPGEG